MSKPTLPPPRVLCIDDHRPLCDTLKENLEFLPARVDTFYDGGSALDALCAPSSAAAQYQLVILDVFLPRSPGDYSEEDNRVLGVKILKAYNLLAPGTPIIIYTNYPSLENCVECIKAGAYDYLPKEDPLTKKDNLPALISRCKDLLYPRPDTLAGWLDSALEQLSERHGGKFVGIIDPRDADRAGIQADIIGDKALIPGDSVEAVRLRMLGNAVLRWVEPCILKIPNLRL